MHAKRSDSVNIWFDAEKSNLGGTVSKQLKLSYFTPTISDTISVSYKAVKDEFKLSNEAGNLIAQKIIL